METEKQRQAKSREEQRQATQRACEIIEAQIIRARMLEIQAQLNTAKWESV